MTKKIDTKERTLFLSDISKSSSTHFSHLLDSKHISYHLASKRYDLFHTQVFMGVMLVY